MKRGFTLMELVVYIAMIGIVVLVAGEAFSNSTKFRVRTQNMLKASEEAANVAAIFRDDVSQMGAKSSKEESGSSSTDSFYVANVSQIYMDPANMTASLQDSSSFRIVGNTSSTDSLVFRRMRYDENGHYASIEEVSWYLTDEKLYRACRVLDKRAGYSFSSDDPCSEENDPEAVEVASGVEKFYVEPAEPGITDLSTVQLLPSTDTSVHNFRLVSRTASTSWKVVTVSLPSTSVSISGFGANYDFDNSKVDETGGMASQVFVAQPNGNAGTWQTLCEQVTLEKDCNYEISFNMPYSENASRMFVPGRDHLSVGFRKVSNGEKTSYIDDFLFYPPVSAASNGTRSMRFTVPDKIENVCLAFTFVSYSPVAASGTLYIGDLTLKKIAFANYTFDDYVPNGRNKQDVKAFRLHLTIKRGGETGEATLVVPTPANGPKG